LLLPPISLAPAGLIARVLDHTQRHRIARGQQGFGITALAQKGAEVQIVTRKPVRVPFTHRPTART
jgi:hypothetical protein